MKRLSIRKKIFLLLLGAYLVVYLLCALNGRFILGAYSARGVKSYIWAPAGFGLQYGEDHQSWLFYFFAPLYYLDVLTWHTRERAFSGNYPRDETPIFVFPGKSQ